SIVLVVDPSRSRTAVLKAARPAVRDLARKHRGTRRWLSGSSASPATFDEDEAGRIKVDLNLAYTFRSMMRALDSALTRALPHLKRRPRQRRDHNLVLSLWVRYRRLVNPKLANKDLVKELHEELFFSLPRAGIIDEALSQWGPVHASPQGPIFADRRRRVV